MPSTLTTPTTTVGTDVWRPLEDTDHTAAVSVVLKLRGETCDVDCLYCFEKRKLAPGGAQITPAHIRRLGQIFGERPLAIELHGGEPLTVGKDAMAALLDELAAQPTVHRVHLQTNGVRLDGEWLDLFDAHYPGLHIGISMDGDEQGNSWRVGYDGTAIYPHIVSALNLLAERNRTCGIVTVVTPAVLGRAAEVIDHIADFDAVRAVHLLPAFDTTVTTRLQATGRRTSPSRRLQARAVGADGPAWAITPAQYAAFVLDATARWIDAGHFRRIKLDPAVATIRRLKGLDTAHCHFAAHKCSHVFTAYPDGRLGSCDELPWPQAHLLPLAAARSEADITEAQHANPQLTAGRELMTKCVSCPYRTVCGGGCTATRWRMLKATGSDDAYCDHRGRLTDGMAHLLAAPDHPAGAHCRRAHWRPVDPNVMDDVDAFLARWDDPAAPRTPARLLASDHGNINTAGLPGEHAADDLDPRHPQWREGVEDRVWPLVDTITRSWKAVTYDSCQGHAHTGTGLAPSPFRVGLLPRTRAEYATLAARLCHTLAAADGYLPATVTADAVRSDLTSAETGRRHPVLNLTLTPAPGSTWADYFTGLDQAVHTLTHVARHTPTATGCACALRPPRPTREAR
ncbi:radical SAM protein [Streptomyces sp. SID9727]|uniref:radical SAM/SPASM domain-containing protein n=1 Tax=Streptomyces sp. SID9727 TaxID=2706114 RepID=UPI0013C64DE4|nr:radical SAM protein [Streptomyces sp. SID9727]NEC65897.1 radical SAM protein [Streptomyces sp. SID9727]